MHEDVRMKEAMLELHTGKKIEQKNKSSDHSWSARTDSSYLNDRIGPA